MGINNQRYLNIKTVLEEKLYNAEMYLQNAKLLASHFEWYDDAGEEYHRNYEKAQYRVEFLKEMIAEFVE
jgi:hypothetical protein